MSKNWISPLKAKPLRTPGQSVNDEIQKLFDDKALPTLLAVSALWIVSLIEWLGELRDAPRIPEIYSVLALAATAYAAWQFRQIKRRIVQLRQGRDGEIAVGQFLDGLREDGARIFHDIPAKGFNLDHVVMTQQGIFVIETKTLSKPYPQAKITMENGELLAAGRKMDRDPLAQVRSQISWLGRLLEESTGRTFSMQGVIVFPGWFVERPAEGARLDVWVLSGRELPSFIQHEPARLRSDEVAMASFHLSRYIRSAQDQPS